MEGTGGATGGQVVEGFEGEEKCLEVDALFNGEPVEKLENGSDVFAGPGVGKELATEFWSSSSLWREWE